MKQILNARRKAHFEPCQKFALIEVEENKINVIIGSADGIRKSRKTAIIYIPYEY
jgi:hypothetical protein